MSERADPSTTLAGQPRRGRSGEEAASRHAPEQLRLPTEPRAPPGTSAAPVAIADEAAPALAEPPPTSSLSPPLSIEVRTAIAEDLHALYWLEDQAFTGDQLSRASFQRLLRSPTSEVLVATSEPGPATPATICGYALVLFRDGSRLARLYSIAVSPHAQGRGVGRRLLDAAEHAAAERARTVMRLEVRADNLGALRLYLGRGYREIAKIPDYYADGAEALKLERALVPEPPAPGLRQVHYYAQTTEFTCGPATLAMALETFGVETASPSLELQLWREANCVDLISSPGGCDPIGLALAAQRRGLWASVHASHPGPYFVEVTRGQTAKSIMTYAQDVFRAHALAAGTPVHYQALALPELVAALDRGALAIVLVSPWLLMRSTVPHWVLAYARTSSAIVIHDPYRDPDPARAPAHEAVAIPFTEFEHMAVWGRTRLSATIILEAPTPT
ncbi:MAG: peptidase C39 family protein [Deltaproteobacteria bacterium]|nr:peptidase C39 family protein [Deltaproteobacteria bacterium]